MQTYHEPTDEAKVAEIAASMESDGWVGAPLVTWGDELLLTGAHRYTAAKSLAWPDSDIPTVDIADLAAAQGIDWDAHCAEWDVDGIDSGMLPYAINDAIPAAVRDEYGIDIH